MISLSPLTDELPATPSNLPYYLHNLLKRFFILLKSALLLIPTCIRHLLHRKDTLYISDHFFTAMYLNLHPWPIIPSELDKSHLDFYPLTSAPSMLLCGLLVPVSVPAAVSGSFLPSHRYNSNGHLVLGVHSHLVRGISLKEFFIFYVCFACMFVCAPSEYLVAEETRRGCWIPRKWSYRWLWAAIMGSQNQTRVPWKKSKQS